MWILDMLTGRGPQGRLTPEELATMLTGRVIPSGAPAPSPEERRAGRASSTGPSARRR